MALNWKYKDMKNSKLSGPAVFMYSFIVLTFVLSAVCLILYYGNFTDSGFVKWSGVVSFMIHYQFTLRILFGKITEHIKFNYRHYFFTRKKFESKLYKILNVRKWKDKVLTFDPDAYDFKNRSLHELASTMAKSETDHWINVMISIGGVFFSLIWGLFPVFLVTAVMAILFDAQFIVVQRYNRPIVLRLMERKESIKIAQ